MSPHSGIAKITRIIKKNSIFVKAVSPAIHISESVFALPGSESGKFREGNDKDTALGFGIVVGPLRAVLHIGRVWSTVVPFLKVLQNLEPMVRNGSTLLFCALFHRGAGDLWFYEKVHLDFSDCRHVHRLWKGQSFPKQF